MSPPMTTTLMFTLNYAIIQLLIISFHGQPSGISWGNHIETAEAAAILAMANRELRSRELLLWTSGSTHLLLQPILPLPLCSPFPLVPASIFKKMMLPLSAFSFWLFAFGCKGMRFSIGFCLVLLLFSLIFQKEKLSFMSTKSCWQCWKCLRCKDTPNLYI